ncbi:MAG: GTP cyclohydrolase [Crocinitomicaceae bacterium]|nr:GTP cyclohydrolase [Crocinitomicaceae bacterium]
MKQFRNYGLIAMTIAGIAITSCKKEEVAPPAEENEVEVITDVKLVFTNASDPADVVEANAQDPDGSGAQSLAILNDINLDINKTYILTYEIANNLDSPGEDIGAEILEEDDEHQFFFSFSNDAFTNPTGDGNVDTASDPLDYNDQDDNGFPVGLSTTWVTSGTQLSAGTFNVRLQHQPGVKTATSGANDGDTDFDLTFVLNIQ